MGERQLGDKKRNWDRWWSCHATWIGKNGAPADLLFFVTARTRGDAVVVAKDSLSIMFIREDKLTVMSAPEYKPRSRHYAWQVHRGPWVPSAGSRGRR